MSFGEDIELQHRYGVDVWAHTEMDTLRRTKCLCLNCTRMGCGCGYSEIQYELSKKYNTAMAVTRCPEFSPKPTHGGVE